MPLTRRLILALVFSAALVPVAHAYGTNLAWTDCISQLSAAENISYACDGSGHGSPFKLVASFRPYADLNMFVGVQLVISVANSITHPGPESLPDWWKLGVGQCRDGNLAFPTSMAGIGTGGGATTTCFNPWITAEFTGGGFTYMWPYSGAAYYGRLLAAFARDTPTTLTTEQHYLAGVITLDTFGDVPSESNPNQCQGCCQPMFIILEQVELYQIVGQPPPQQDIYYLTTQDQRNYVTWQYGGPCQQTPTRRTSWGAIKSTYR